MLLRILALSALVAPLARADECDGLVPSSFPAPVVVQGPRPCVGGVADANSMFLLGFTVGSSMTYPDYRFFDASGARIGTSHIMGGDYSSPQPVADAWGFVTHGCSASSACGLNFWGEDGTNLAAVKINDAYGQSSAAYAVDPQGGAVVLRAYQGSTALTFQRYDVDGTDLSGESDIGDGTARQPYQIAINSVGDIFVSAPPANSSGPSGLWIDAWGYAFTDFFTMPAGQAGGALLDGSIVWDQWNGTNGFSHTYVIADGDSAATPAPDWLAARAGQQFAVIRGGGGYAFWGNGSVCGRGVEILAPSGNSCGCVSAPTIATRSSSIGFDGTWIVGHDEPDRCSYELYLGVFQ